LANINYVFVTAQKLCCSWWGSAVAGIYC